MIESDDMVWGTMRSFLVCGLCYTLPIIRLNEDVVFRQGLNERLSVATLSARQGKAKH